MKNLASLQVARALAVLLVVMHHAHGVIAKRATELRLAEEPFWAQDHNQVKMGAVGVDIFFVLSGFIIYYISTRRQMSVGMFLASRVIRLYPLWWVALGLMVLMAALPGSSAEAQGMALLRSALLWPYQASDGHIKPFLPIGWSLHYEIYFNVMFAVAMACCWRQRLAVCTALLGGLLLAGAVWPSQTPVVVIASNWLIGEFLVGMWMARAYQAGVRWGDGLSLLALAFVVVLAMIYMSAESPWTGQQQTLIRGSMAIALIAALALGQRFSSWAYPRAFTFIGDASYSIFLFHMFPIMVLSGLWKRGMVLPPEGMHPAWTWLWIVIVSTLVGVVFHLAVERPLLVTLKRGFLSPRVGHEPVRQQRPI